MTFIIGMKCKWAGKEAVLLAADKSATLENQKYMVSKIHQISSHPILYAGAGPVGKLQFLKKILIQHIEDEYNQPQKEFQVDIDYYGLLWKRSQHMKRDPEGPPSYLVASSDRKGNAGLHKVTGSVEECEEKWGYICIGSGQISGGTILLNMMLPQDHLLTLDEAAEAAVTTISIIGASPFVHGVSAQCDIYATCIGQIGRLKETSKTQLLKKIEQRRNILRAVWLFPGLGPHLLKEMSNLKKNDTESKEESDIWKKKKVLLIDDEVGLNSDMGKKLKRILKSKETELVFRNNGEEGLKAAIEDEEICLILLDHLFKGKNQTMQGPEIFKKIREKRPTLPIVGLSSYKEYKESFMELGSLLFMGKDELEDKQNILLSLIEESKKGLRYQWIWE